MNHTLIPITSLKIDKQRWLTTPIQYEDNYMIKDVIEIMCQKTYQWILSTNDLTTISDYGTFLEQFTNLMYDKYIDT